MAVPRPRTKEGGNWQVPPDWPSWKKVCGANKRKGRGICQSWAVKGMPTCKLHGSGGEKNRELGMIRYMCWVILGGPQNMPIDLACTTALAVFTQAVFDNGKGTPQQMMKAALWLTETFDSQ